MNPLEHTDRSSSDSDLFFSDCARYLLDSFWPAQTCQIQQESKLINQLRAKDAQLVLRFSLLRGLHHLFRCSLHLTRAWLGSLDDLQDMELRCDQTCLIKAFVELIQETLSWCLGLEPDSQAFL